MEEMQDPTETRPMLSQERLHELVLQWRLTKERLTQTRRLIAVYEGGSSPPAEGPGPFVPSIDAYNRAALAGSSAGELAAPSLEDARGTARELEEYLGRLPRRLEDEGMPQGIWVGCGERSYLLERNRRGLVLREGLTGVVARHAGRHEPDTIEWRSRAIERRAPSSFVPLPILWLGFAALRHLDPVPEAHPALRVAMAALVGGIYLAVGTGAVVTFVSLLGVLLLAAL